MPRKSPIPIFYGPKAAIGYVRVSTLDQATEGVSLDAQEARLRAYCAAQGLELVRLVRDEGVSASKPLSERPGGQQVVRMLGRGRAQHVVALKLDRLFRDAADALQQTRNWDSAGIALHLLDMGGTSMNTASAMGRMMLTMMAAFAELERNLIAERTTFALRFKKAQGDVYARTPLGYQRLGNRLVEDAGEMLVIRRIQHLHTLGWPYSKIAAQFNIDRVPTKRGGRWHASTVRYIARNDLYDSEGLSAAA